MREIPTKTIKSIVKGLILEAGTQVNKDLYNEIKKAHERELSEIGEQVLLDMIRNFQLAQEKLLPMCQDTGMAIIFLEVGQDVHFTDGFINDAIQDGVREAYEEGYFRKSVVKDPFDRVNTQDNTPAIIHTTITKGDKVKITVCLKGFGSENTSALKMLKPADGLEGAVEFINETIKQAIPNGCAPLIVGIGIGGDFEQAALNAKTALTRPITYEQPDEFYKKLEKQIEIEANNTGIGPMGLGGINSVLRVHINPAPTHIAGLPVAVNICCYADRVKEMEI